MVSERVLVAMSGGVDSAVAAALMQEQGFDAVGVTLHLWDASGAQAVGRCCSPIDREDARHVCDALGIPHYTFDERSDFRERVVAPFIAAYSEGRTPSPCVRCNSSVKLGQLQRIADELGAGRIVTGHYARVLREGGQVRLHRGLDESKDQSYFLYGLERRLLERLETPLGALRKGEVRALAKRFALPNANKPDSQELCFVPDGDIPGFLAREGSGSGEGEVVDEAGQVLGRHQGLEAFTVGQRRGLGLGGGAARFVLKLVPEQRQVVVGERESLMANGLEAEAASWTSPGLQESFVADVKVRYRHRAARAQVCKRGDGFVVRFDEPQRAITPGQAAVLYAGTQVLGGGTIRCAA